MSNEYQDKLNQYIESIKNLMYTFEVTKCCDYSTFVTIYKDETLIDLYEKIILHFGGIEIVDLYFISSQGEHIPIPLSKKPVFQFVRENILCKPIKWVPVYPVPNPVVYRIQLDDGHRHD
jgi:hypothetical protein